MRAIKKTINYVISYLLLIVILLLIAFHIALVSSYLNDHFGKSIIQQKRLMNHQVLALFANAANNTSLAQFNNLIQKINNDSLQVGHYRVFLSLSKKPLFDSSNPINTPAPNYATSTSVKLNNNIWLNYKAKQIYNYYYTFSLITITEFTLFGLYFFYALSLQRFREPLANFKDSATRFGIELQTKPIKLFGPKIVQETAQAMNHMQQHIQELINNRTKMLAAISHDLRNPITRLKLRTELLADEQQAGKFANDLTEMEQMIQSILDFASEDILREKKIAFDLNSLLLAIGEDFLDQNRSIEMAIEQKQLIFFGAKLALKRTFTNLIQNGLKYAGKVWLQVTYDQEKVFIYIRDNGPGIPEDELKKVLEPYYRSRKAVTHAIGSGLGLSIAQEVIQAHEGTIVLANREEGGLEVRVSLPLIFYTE